MDKIVQLLFDGLALGSVYALVALGFVVIYRASQVFNFAQGELLVFGGLSFWTFSEALGLPWGLALVAAMVSTGVLGVAIERLALRPLIGKPVFVTIIVTIFVGLILRTLMILAWGTDPHPVATPWEPGAVVEIAGARVSLKAIATVGAAALALGGYFWLIRKTRLGVAMRATSSDQETALGMGIPVGRVFALSWFIAGSMAALGGMFLGMYPRMGVDVTLSFDALQAFPAVIIGGLDSAGGAVIAGVLLGVSVVFAEVYLGKEVLGEFGDGFHRVFPYLLMIVFLVVRPYGIFGTRRVERI